MSSKEAIELGELIEWAKETKPWLLDERFCNYDGWTQLATLRWELAKHCDFDEERMDIIGQNGNTGEHYGD